MNNDLDRPDILQQIPLTAVRILDIGCGTGRLGAAVKARQDCEYLGVERDEQAAAAAQARGLEITCGDAEVVGFHDGDEFDCIILGDILEHLREPEALLRRLWMQLAATGTLIVSVPNAASQARVRARDISELHGQ